MTEQAKIEAQLHELEGMRDIQVGLELTHINEDEQMCVDKTPPEPRPIEAKQRALEKFVRVAPPIAPPPPPRHSLLYPSFACLYLLFIHLHSRFVSGKCITSTMGRQGARIITRRSRGT
jgi:hypothetical protein